MTLENYLRTGEGIGTKLFYLESTQTDGQTTFYLHPVDQAPVGGEPRHYAVLGNLIEPIEPDTIRDGKQQIDALRSELDKCISSLGLTFFPAEESSDNIPALLQKARQVLAAFQLERDTQARTMNGNVQDLDHLKNELLRHEQLMGIQVEDANNFSTFASRIEYILGTYRKQLRGIEIALKETVNDLSLVAQCETRLTANDWASSTYGCIQVLIVKICGLAADRLRRSLKDSSKYNGDEF